MQLAAVGKQDVSLRGSFSLFLTVFRRATRFAMWTDELAMDYTPGKRSTVDIPKSGDLLADVTLQITLPALPGPATTWCASVGYAMLRRVRLVLNDQEIHNIERLWYDIYDSLYTSAGHAAGLRAMVGRAPLPTDRKHVLFVPLRLLTCRKGASRPPLPLQAIPRSTFRLDIEFEDPSVLCAALKDDPGIQVRVLCDLVELEEPEKTRVIRPHTLAFESVIDSDALSYYMDSDGIVRDKTAVKVNLGNVRFAVKMLAWVAYVENGALFTYIPRPIDQISVTFNNQDRLVPRPADYFHTIQKYQHCAASDGAPPGVYSFALNATSRYPSGTADFGALSAAALQADVVPGAPRFKLKVFSVYYNFLEFGGSSGKVAFV
jgi:hypothetical protein